MASGLLQKLIPNHKVQHHIFKMVLYFAFVVCAGMFATQLNEQARRYDVQKHLEGLVERKDARPLGKIELNLYHCEELNVQKLKQCARDPSASNKPADFIANNIPKTFSFEGRNVPVTFAHVKYQLTDEDKEWFKVKANFIVLALPRHVHHGTYVSLDSFESHELLQVGYGADTSFTFHRDDLLQAKSIELLIETKGLPYVGPTVIPAHFVRPRQLSTLYGLVPMQVESSDLARQFELGLPVVLAAIAIILDHSVVMSYLSLYAASRAIHDFIGFRMETLAVSTLEKNIYYFTVGSGLAFLLLFTATLVGLNVRRFKLAHRWMFVLAMGALFCVPGYLSANWAKSWSTTSDIWGDSLATTSCLLVVLYAGFERLTDFLTQDAKPDEAKSQGKRFSAFLLLRFFFVFHEEYARVRDSVERERRLQNDKPTEHAIVIPVLLSNVHVIFYSVYLRFRNSLFRETKASNPETYSRITIALAVTRVAILCAALGIHGWANISELFGHVNQGEMKTRLDWRTSVLVPALMTAALLEVGSTAKKMLNFARDMAAKALFEQELNVGREVQSRMLPNLRSTTPSWHWRAMYLPAEALAGDWFDIREICFSDGRTLLAACVADVTGHGVGSSLATSVICSHWGLWCTRLQASGFPESPEAKQQKLKRAPFGIHRGLSALRENENCTAIFALFDPTRNELTFSSAGHPGILVIGKKSFRYFTTQGERLGGELSKDVSWSAKTEVLNADDLVVLYSDGVVPLRATVSSWAAQIKRKVNAGGVEKPEVMLVNQLRANKHGFVSAPDLKDDMTLVMVRRNTDGTVFQASSERTEGSVQNDEPSLRVPDVPASA